MADAGGAVAVITFQDGHSVAVPAVLDMHNPRNSGGKIGAVRLKLSAAQRLLKGQLTFHALIDGISLIPICHDGIAAQHPHRRINNQAGILQFGGIKSLGADALPSVTKTRLRLLELLPMIK